MRLLSESRVPLVSVMVPALDEQKDIGGCLAAIAQQQYDLTRLEVVLVDALSTDETVGEAKNAARDLGLSLVLCENPARCTSAGLNVGLAVARGDYVVRVDARSRIGPRYVTACVDTLRNRPDVGVVGGAQVTIPRGDRLKARAIARASNNRWLMGLARYRRGARSGATDTVWMGAFRTAELRAIGGWDANTGINEDYELNERFRRDGKLVWFDASLQSGYLPRSDLRRIARQFVGYGRGKADGWARGRRPAARHVALVLAPPALVAGGAVAVVTFGPIPVVVAGVVAVLAIDLTGGAGVAAPTERIAALAVNALVGASWWWGVVSGWAGRSAHRRSRRSR